jgi:hypothetical protein
MKIVFCGPGVSRVSIELKPASVRNRRAVCFPQAVPNPAPPSANETVTDFYFEPGGYARMKLLRFGILTCGSVRAFMTSLSAMIPFRWRRYAVTA